MTVSIPHKLILIIVLVGILLLSPSAGGVAVSDGVPYDTSAKAYPPTLGANATHVVIIGTEATPKGTVLTGIRVSYNTTENLTLTVPPDYVQAYLYRNISGNFTQQELHPTAITISNRTIEMRLAGNVTLRKSDAVKVQIFSVENPSTPKNVTVTAVLNPEGENRSTVQSTMEFYTPTPELSLQGRVGDYHRIAIKWPAMVNGFLVATTASGRVVGSQHQHPRRTLHIDSPLPRLVEADVEKPATITVTAYQDSNGNGEFDPQEDVPFKRDGENVSVTVSNALVTTTTTTESTTANRGNTTARSSRTTESASVPGFSVSTSLMAALTAALLARRA